MRSSIKCLALSLFVLLAASMTVQSATTEPILLEVFARARTRQEAERIAADINQGRVKGWSMAEVNYEPQTRYWLVEAVREDELPPDAPPVEIPRLPGQPLPAPPPIPRAM
ncbi:MAG: hypothetical protein FJ303_00510 [Planctomycetes bacterium]|nr:hypothetical protein [Planctomycetota bacterium]